jgi:hypothetical protein
MEWNEAEWMELNGKKVPFHRLKEDTSSLVDLENERNN